MAEKKICRNSRSKCSIQRHSGITRTPKIESCAAIVNGWKPLTIVAKLFIFDVCRDPGYAPATEKLKSFTKFTLKFRWWSPFWVDAHVLLHKHLCQHFAGCLLWIVWNYLEQLLYRTRVNGCFWFIFESIPSINMSK